MREGDVPPGSLGARICQIGQDLFREPVCIVLAGLRQGDPFADDDFRDRVINVELQHEGVADFVEGRPHRINMRMASPFPPARLPTVRAADRCPILPRPLRRG